MFDGLLIFKNSTATPALITKFERELEAGIYRRVMRQPVSFRTGPGPFGVQVREQTLFWMKAFRKNEPRKSHQYFGFETPLERDYFYLLVNSSLFWWYWECVSDCWHVTSVMNGFRAPECPGGSRVHELARDLEQKLEETKVYIGSAQAENAYRHRLCLREIRAIDDFIAGLYGLTEEENGYVKNYDLDFRTAARPEKKRKTAAAPENRARNPAG